MFSEYVREVSQQGIGGSNRCAFVDRLTLNLECFVVRTLI